METSGDMTKLFLELFSYRTWLYEGPTDSFEDYDPSWHVLVSISRDISSHSDDETDATIPKKLEGIRGSSIWQGYAADYQLADKWTSDDASLVAVQTGIYDSQGDVVVRGTRWSGVVAIRRAEFRGNVAFVKTAQFARPKEESPCVGHGHHWFANAESYFLIGGALGEGMTKLIGVKRMR